MSSEHDLQRLPDVIDFLGHFYEMNDLLQSTFDGARRLNMPQEISEYIVCVIGRKCCGRDMMSSKFGNDGVKMSGDAHTSSFSKVEIVIEYTDDGLKCVLVPRRERIEIKNFSNGPISFGPTEPWDTLLILDGSTRNTWFKLYEIPHSNDSDVWSNIKVNKTQTFRDQCKQQRRPRMKFKAICKKLKDNPPQLLWQGDIRDLLKT